MRNLANRKPNTLRGHRAKRVGQKAFAPVLTAGLLTAGLMTIGIAGGDAEAKTPGKSYCFYGKCHRVKTIAETQALIGVDETLSASHYDSCKRDRYNPCGLTSSGAVFDSEAPDNAASPIYPDGTTLLVWAPDTRVSVVLRVNNAGPYWGDRKLDVSRKAAEVLGFAGQGVATLKVRVIDAPTAEEATYKKGRKYDPVPGYIGQFASLDDAQTGAATAYMVAGLTSPIPTDPALGAGNPTQVAGSQGTQSGATLVVPTVLAAVAPPPADLIETAPMPSEIKPVQVAAAVIPADVEEPVAKEPTPVAKKTVAEPVARSRAYAERAAPANSRAYRQAARKSRDKVRVAPVAVASVDEKVTDKRIVTRDGTNDMSVFARQTYAGVDRIASQEPMRRRPYYSSLGRDVRDRNDG